MQAPRCSKWYLHSDRSVERRRLLQGQELNVFSEKTNHPLWRIVRKSVAQAFQANNMRCGKLPRPPLCMCA